MPNILLIHTGGTLMMRREGTARPLEPSTYAADLLAELPVLKQIAEIETQILFNLDSGDIQPHHWVELAGMIHEGIEDYDGVVVIHGTDAMAYTASALAYLLPGLDKPVVLTGAQHPIFDVRTDARTNLVDACLIATLPVPEVGIAFADRFFRGCRSTKMDAWGLDAFDSPRCPPLVELGLGARIADHVLPARPGGAFDGRLDPNVVAVRVIPGLAPRQIDCAIDAGIRGLVLEAYGTGTIPRLESSLIPSIRSATDKDVPVVIVSQCPRGSIQLSRYSGAAAAAEAGAISGGDMTTEAAVTKLMVLLGRATEGRVVDSVGRAFRRPLLGEMTPEPVGA